MEALGEGQEVHCYAIRRGIDLLDEALQTAIVDMYARCGASHMAASMLRILERTYISSWNAMIYGLLKWGKSAEALEVFTNLEVEAKVYPDSITLSNIMVACADIGCPYRAKDIHCYLMRRNILFDLVMATSLVDLYFDYGKIGYARKLFDDILVKDTVLYNVIISGYLQVKEIGLAMDLLRKMYEEGVVPNSATMVVLLSSFSDITDTRLGRLVHGFIVRLDHPSNLDVFNQILRMYAKWGCIHTTRKVFESLKEKDMVSWTIMMMSYTDSGNAENALYLFRLMRKTREKLDSAILITLLKAYMQIGNLVKVKEIHSYIYRTLCDKDSAAINSVISAYAKCGRVDMAGAVFVTMGKESTTTWNTMVNAYAIHGFAGEVLRLFYEMRRLNISPDGMTYTSALSACSHCGLIEEGWHVFKALITDHYVSPSTEHYNCMVDLLGRSGQLDEAYELVMLRPPKDRISALCSLLAACKFHKNARIGEVVGKELLELQPQNAGFCSLVSNIYSEASMWSKAIALRRKAKTKGLRKSPGLSLALDE